MKKIFCLAAVLLITGAAFAQTTDTTNTHDTTGMQMMHDSMMQSGTQNMNGMHGMNGQMRDCIMMMNGKVMVMRNGQHTLLTQNMRLANNSVVMPDGTVQMANNTTHKLKNGECVYMDGTLGKMGNMKGKRNMGSDSTMQTGKDSTRM